MDKHPIPLLPRILLFILLIAAFIVLEIFTYSYREKGILRKKTPAKEYNKRTQPEEYQEPLKEKGGILILLTISYLSLSTAMLYLIFKDKQYLSLGLALHVLLLALCLLSYFSAILINYERIFSIARFFFSLALSPTVLLIFIASYPLYRRSLYGQG